MARINVSGANFCINSNDAAPSASHSRRKISNPNRSASRDTHPATADISHRGAAVQPVYNIYSPYCASSSTTALPRRKSMAVAPPLSTRRSLATSATPGRSRSAERARRASPGPHLESQRDAAVCRPLPPPPPSLLGTLDREYGAVARTPPVQPWSPSGLTSVNTTAPATASARSTSCSRIIPTLVSFQ